MTRDDIIKMAREAGLSPNAARSEKLACFAALVSAAEREACAKVCEGMARPIDDEMMSDAQWIASSCSRAIRARGGDVSDG
jgi:hypothetical protein